MIPINYRTSREKLSYEVRHPGGLHESEKGNHEGARCETIITGSTTGKPCYGRDRTQPLRDAKNEGVRRGKKD